MSTLSILCKSTIILFWNSCEKFSFERFSISQNKEEKKNSNLNFWEWLFQQWNTSNKQIQTWNSILALVLRFGWCLPPLSSSNVVGVKNNLAVAPGHKTFPFEQVMSEVFLTSPWALNDLIIVESHPHSLLDSWKTKPQTMCEVQLTFKKFSRCYVWAAIVCTHTEETYQGRTSSKRKNKRIVSDKKRCEHSNRELWLLQKVTGLLHRREPQHRQAALKLRSAVSLQTFCRPGQLVYTGWWHTTTLLPGLYIRTRCGMTSRGHA